MTYLDEIRKKAAESRALIDAENKRQGLIRKEKRERDEAEAALEKGRLIESYSNELKEKGFVDEFKRYLHDFATKNGGLPKEWWVNVRKGSEANFLSGRGLSDAERLPAELIEAMTLIIKYDKDFSGMHFWFHLYWERDFRETKCLISNEDKRKFAYWMKFRIDYPDHLRGKK